LLNQHLDVFSLNVDFGSQKSDFRNQYFDSLDVGIHLHSNPAETYAKIASAWNAGCNRFDVAIGGYGGCPFASDKLIGNIATEKMLNFVADNKIHHSLDLFSFENACNQSKAIFQ